MLTKILDIKFVKFLLGGGSALVLQICTLFVLEKILGYLFASIFTFILIVIYNYFIQKKLVFKDSTTNQKTKFTLFVVVALVNLILNTGLMYLLVSVFGLNYLLAQTLIIGFISINNFFIYGIIFKEKI